MSSEDIKNQEIQNSDVIKQTLFSLIYVANSKTSKDYAWSIIKTLLIELRKNHAFLKYIHIDEIENLRNSIEDITVLSDFNKVKPKDIGRAIQNIVDIFKTRMGTKAGYFFISEFKETLGEEYYSILQEMGVDLRLIDMEKKIFGWDKEKHRIKDKFDSNIAYVEKGKEE